MERGNRMVRSVWRWWEPVASMPGALLPPCGQRELWNIIQAIPEDLMPHPWEARCMLTLVSRQKLVLCRMVAAISCGLCGSYCDYHCISSKHQLEACGSCPSPLLRCVSSLLTRSFSFCLETSLFLCLCRGLRPRMAKESVVHPDLEWILRT